MGSLITIEGGIAVLDANIVAQIVSFEQQAKSVKAAEDALKSAILSEMEAHGISKIQTPEMVISLDATPLPEESIWFSENSTGRTGMI